MRLTPNQIDEVLEIVETCISSSSVEIGLRLADLERKNKKNASFAPPQLRDFVLIFTADVVQRRGGVCGFTVVVVVCCHAFQLLTIMPYA